MKGKTQQTAIEALQNQRAITGLVSKAANKALELIRQETKTSQIKIASSSNTLKGYPLNGGIQINAEVAYKGAMRKVSIPFSVTASSLISIDAEVVKEKLAIAVDKTASASIESIVKKAKGDLMSGILNREIEEEELNNLNFSEDGVFNGEGWVDSPDDDEIVARYKDSAYITKGADGYVAYTTEGDFIGSGANVLEVRELVEDYVGSGEVVASNKLYLVKKKADVSGTMFTTTERQCLVDCKNKEQAEFVADFINKNEVEIKALDAKIEGSNGDIVSFKIYVLDDKDAKEKLKKIEEQIDTAIASNAGLMTKEEVDVQLAEKGNDEGGDNISEISAAVEVDGVNSLLVVADSEEHAKEVVASYNKGMVKWAEVKYKDTTVVALEYKAPKQASVKKEAKKDYVASDTTPSNVAKDEMVNGFIYSKASLPDLIEAGDTITLPNGKFKIEENIINGQPDAQNWKLSKVE